MFGIIVEVMAIVMALFGAIGAEEVQGGDGAGKKDKVIATITKELTDKGGLEITNKWVLMALPKVLPFLVDQVVRMANKSGFLSKSGK